MILTIIIPVVKSIKSSCSCLYTTDDVKLMTTAHSAPPDSAAAPTPHTLYPPPSVPRADLWVDLRDTTQWLPLVYLSI